MNPTRIAAALRALADAIEAPAEGEPANTVEAPPRRKRPARPLITTELSELELARARAELERHGYRGAR